MERCSETYWIILHLAPLFSHLCSELALFSAQPVYCSIGICNSSMQPLPTYRCLLKVKGVELDVKQSPVWIHKRFQHLMPVFTRIYHDICGDRYVRGHVLLPVHRVPQYSVSVSVPVPVSRIRVSPICKWCVVDSSFGACKCMCWSFLYMYINATF